jgi:hypothetical protein
MKKILLIILVGYLLTSSVSGQWPGRDYPGRQLSELTQPELQALYQKARSMKNTGEVISITGFVATGIGLGAYVFGGMIDFLSLLGSGETTMPSSYYNFAGAMSITGLVFIAIGAPLWSTGKSRIKQISVLPNFTNPKTTLSISPSFRYCQTQNKFIPGVTLAIRF